MLDGIAVSFLDNKYCHLNRFYLPLVLLLCVLSSCDDDGGLKEVVNNGEIFNFTMEDQQSDTILNSYAVEVVIDNPKPLLNYTGRQIECSKFETRGETSLKFRRKSFNVNLDGRAEIYDFTGIQSYSDDFKLLSLSMDYTYINNRLAFKIFNHVGLWDLHTFYTEVALNGDSQGLYLFVQDPVDYFKRVLNSEFIIRRGYHALIKRFSRNKATAVHPNEHYISQFNRIYNVIREYDGEDLYQELSNYLDVEEYMRKIAVDYLLKNGDYTDELFLYLKEKEGKLVYGVLPWDYDDIFSDHPHEIGRDWGVGRGFGIRQYTSQKDIQNEVGDKMIFSIEDDLDYKIASDDYLYNMYLIQLSNLMTELNDGTLSRIVSEVFNEVRPFYEDKEIVKQSIYDRKETSKTRLFENVGKIERFLMNRRNQIFGEFVKQLWIPMHNIMMVVIATGVRRWIWLLQLVVIVSCDSIGISECDECYRISRFETKSNYKSTVKLINDKYDQNQTISLNGSLMNFDTVLVFDEPNFYELIIDPSGENFAEADTFLFTIQDPDRGITEWGLRAWTPLEFEEGLITTEEIEMIYPPRYLEGILFPVIVDVKEAGIVKPVYVRSLLNNESFNIKRGRGSLNIDPTENGEIVFKALGRNQTLRISKNLETPVVLPILLEENRIIPKNTIVHIQSDMTISQGVSLVFSEGSVAIIDEAVTIRNEGKIEFNGTPDNRVLITSSEKGKYWGGFISSGSAASVRATETFFCYSGYNTTPEHAYGHAQRQALFKLENTTIDVENSYFIDHIGQLFYPTSSQLDLRNIYVQRVKSTGEMSGSNLRLSDSYLTDFPDDTQNFRDEDNDALYISNSNVTITNCTFMYAKDDGVDSGSDRNGGTIVIEDSHFEACFHEGAALSSYEGNKSHTIRRSTFQNCGQGIELGFSSPQHSVIVEDCLFQNNLIGIRYGDNYSSSDLNGRMQIMNSLSINNLERDIWNMGHKRWAPTLEHLSFENTFISISSDQYPEVDTVSN